MQMLRVILTLSILAAPVALFAQDKPKPTEKPDDPKAKPIELKLIGGLKVTDDKGKAEETKPAKPIEVELKGAFKAIGDKPNPQEAKPAKPVEVELKGAFKALGEKLHAQEAKPAKPSEVELKATLKAVGDKPGKDQLLKPAKLDEQWKIELKLVPEKKPAVFKGDEVELEFKIVPSTPANAKADEPKPAETKPATAPEEREAKYHLQFRKALEAKQAEAKPAKPEEPQKPGKPADPQYYRVQVRDDGADQKLEKLEAQLQALLKEIQALRAGKAGWEKKPMELKVVPAQP